MKINCLINRLIPSMVLLIIFMLPVSTVCLSCASTTMKHAPSVDIWNFEGWIDEDTYHVISKGECGGTLQERYRNDCAKARAIVRAQARIILQFKNARIKIPVYGDVTEYEYMNTHNTREIMMAVKGGNAVAEKYDEQHGCTIVYEARTKGLKKMADSTDLE